MALYKEYDIIDPGTRDALRERLIEATMNNSSFPITTRERLDELTARRRDATETDFQLEIHSFHTGRDGFAIVKLAGSDTFGRIDYGPDQLILTMTNSDEPVIPTS